MGVTRKELKTIEAHQAEAPVDITVLVTALGLKVYKSRSLGRGVSGMIERDVKKQGRSGYSITVNAAEPYRRRRFTLAHECAHYLLHRDVMGKRLSDNIMYQSLELGSQEEFRANNLAAWLLMPLNLIDDAIRQGFTGISKLADRFDVSEAVMRVRLGYLHGVDQSYESFNAACAEHAKRQLIGKSPHHMKPNREKRS